MNQVTQSFPSTDTTLTGPADRIGFDIGWDHAHHGLVPPAELLHQGTPVMQGWLAGKAVFGRRTLTTSRATRQWLATRLLAWRSGIHFETQQLNANHFAQIHTERCPVQRSLLGGAPGQDDAAVVERLNPQAGYAAGNLAVISQIAARAAQDVDLMGAVRQARVQEAGAPASAGLETGAWWRLAVLRSFATPLPFHEAARLPLAVLPPNRVRLLNAVQGLQTLITRLFMAPGWAARCRQLAKMLPAHTLRHDFNLFVGAMAPRVLEADSQPHALRLALEDAWLNDRVQRRWQHLVLSLGEGATERLLDQAVAAGLAGRHVLQHAPEQALEGWALERQGQAKPLAEIRPRPQPVRKHAAAPSAGTHGHADGRECLPLCSATGSQSDGRLAHRQAFNDGFALHGVGPAPKSRHRFAVLVDQRDVVNPGTA
jgi:hypothetical protein